MEKAGALRRGRTKRRAISIDRSRNWLRGEALEPHFAHQAPPHGSISHPAIGFSYVHCLDVRHLRDDQAGTRDGRGPPWRVRQGRAPCELMHEMGSTGRSGSSSATMPGACCMATSAYRSSPRLPLHTSSDLVSGHAGIDDLRDDLCDRRLAFRPGSSWRRGARDSPTRR